MGLIGLVSPFTGGWGIRAAVTGAVYLGFAGLRHIAKRGKNADETVATRTDLLVFVMVTVGAIAIEVRELTPPLTRGGRYRIRTCEAFATDLQSAPIGRSGNLPPDRLQRPGRQST